MQPKRFLVHVLEEQARGPLPGGFGQNPRQISRSIAQLTETNAAAAANVCLTLRRRARFKCCSRAISLYIGVFFKRSFLLSDQKSRHKSPETHSPDLIFKYFDLISTYLLSALRPA